MGRPLRQSGRAAEDKNPAPGNKAGGANVICFTTGRGSVFGSKPVPSVNLATNSLIYRHMEEDMVQ